MTARRPLKTVEDPKLLDLESTILGSERIGWIALAVLAVGALCGVLGAGLGPRARRAHAVPHNATAQLDGTWMPRTERHP